MQVPTPPGQALDAHPGNVSLHHQICCVFTASLICCACTCNTKVNKEQEKAMLEHVCSSPYHGQMLLLQMEHFTHFAHTFWLSLHAQKPVKLHHNHML